MSSTEAIVFWILAPLAVVGAVSLLFARKAVHAAMGMVLTMLLLGVFYILNNAEFLGVIQVFVYSGAVMMLFLFVVMLVGVDASDSRIETLPGQRWGGYLMAILLGGVLAWGIFDAVLPRAGLNGLGSGFASMELLGESIFGRYVWVFEILSALLITAALGAMVLAHRERLLERPTQADWARRRIARGQFIAGKPGPGVYARHNAADAPALLPDGTPSELSVPRVLQAREQVAPVGDYEAAEKAITTEIQEGSQR